MDEYGYVYNGMLPENSESGSQQSPIACVEQLRFVEETLVELYARERMKYAADSSIPAGLKGRVKRRRDGNGTGGRRKWIFFEA
jgi:hypothetical protein